MIGRAMSADHENSLLLIKSQGTKSNKKEREWWGKR